VAETAAPAPLIAPAGGVQGGAAGPVGTAPRAVAIAAIAAAAEEEDLTAVATGADHESERVHRSSRTLREGMDTREEMCELWIWDRLNRVSRGLARGSGGVEPSGPSPSRRPGGNGLPYGWRFSQPALSPAVRSPESRPFY
jgi:hypothetical protein